MVVKDSICAFVISLKRDLCRRKYIEQHFFERNVTFEWFSAVDGLTLSSNDITHYCPHSYSNYRWELTPSDIGCFESHKRIWNIIIERGLKNALIFEDDVFLVPSFLSRITSIIDTGIEFDIVKLDTHGSTIRLGAVRSHIDGIQIRRLLSPAPGAAAYMISRQGCIYLVARSKQYCDTLDDFITKNLSEERIYQLVPSLAAQQSHMKKNNVCGMSEIPDVNEGQRGKIDKNFPPRRKGPILYRLMKELRRNCRKIFIKFYGNKSLIRKGGIVTEVKLLKMDDPYRSQWQSASRDTVDENPL